MAEWSDLQAELDAWSAIGSTATFWWRDDDAVSVTPQLDRLLQVSGEHEVPLSLAVIPARAEAALARRMESSTHCTTLQHGFAHLNHAPPDQKKSELGNHRSPDDVLDELLRGHRLLTRNFVNLLPVLVPPWNRISPDVVVRLNEIGLRGLSTFAPREVSLMDLCIANTHVDILDWHGSRGFKGTSQTLEQAVGHLRARRLGDNDATEATGVLSHHLVHDEECWQFLHDFFSLTRAHSASRWLSANDIFSNLTSD